MSEEKKARPATHIESADEAAEKVAESVEQTTETACENNKSQGASDTSGESASPEPGQSGIKRLVEWFDTTFPHNKGAVIGGILGLAVALLLFAIGLFKTLLIVVLILIGVAAGQYIDGDPKLVRMAQKFIKKH